MGPGVGRFVGQPTKTSTVYQKQVLSTDSIIPSSGTCCTLSHWLLPFNLSRAQPNPAWAPAKRLLRGWSCLDVISFRVLQTTAMFNIKKIKSIYLNMVQSSSSSLMLCMNISKLDLPVLVNSGFSTLVDISTLVNQVWKWSRLYELVVCTFMVSFKLQANTFPRLFSAVQYIKGGKLQNRIRTLLLLRTRDLDLLGLKLILDKLMSFLRIQGSPCYLA